MPLKIFLIFAVAFSAPMSRAGVVAAHVASQPSVEEAFVKSVREQLAHMMERPASEFQVSVDSFRLSPAITVPNVVSVQALGLGSAGAKRLDGLFSLPIVIQSKTLTQEVQATGILKVIGPVFVSRRNLPRGQIVQSEDLNMITMPWRTLPAGAAAVTAKALIGQRVKSHVTSGDPLYSDVLMEALDVQNGDMVELTVVAEPGVMIRSRAVARQEGHTGDLIRLEQPDTKKLLSGYVTGRKAVEVRL